MLPRTLVGLMVAGGALALPAVLSASGCAPEVRMFGGAGGSSSASSGTGKDGGACPPGEMVPCYDGPAGTEGVGICAAGKATCDKDGKPGACVGEVTPAPKIDCTKHEDQNCDGVTDLCPLDYIWGKAFGVAGGSGFVPPSLGVDPNGNIFIAGFTNGQVDFGTGTVIATSGNEDIFVAKLDPTGKGLWAKKIGDPVNNHELIGAGTDAQGNLYVAGSYDGTLDGLGVNVPAGAGNFDAFVAKLDNDGNAVWAQSGGDSNEQNVESLAVAPTGEVAIAGRFNGTFSFTGGGGTFSAPLGGGPATFVQRFDNAGNSTWGVTLANNAPDAGYADQEVVSMAVDLNGDVVVSGYFQGSIGFPDGTNALSAGGYDIFVVKLRKNDGSVAWAKTYGGVGDDEALGASTDSQGNVLVSGSFQTSLTMDAFSVMAPMGFTSSMFLAKLTPAGSVSWLNGYGGATQVVGMLTQAAENDDILLCGAFDGTANFGGSTLTAQPFMMGQLTAAGFIAKLDSNGNHIGSRSFQPVPTPVLDGGQPPPDFAIIYRIAAAPKTNDVVMAGLAIGQIDLGGGLVGVTGAASPVVGKYAP